MTSRPKGGFKVIYTLSETNEAVKCWPEKIVERAENKYDFSLLDVCGKIVSESIETVFLAGPSASGKTTTAQRLCQDLEEKGKRCITVSLDDFYRVKGDYPILPNGAPDYETVQALDLPLFGKCFKELHDDGKSDFPVFDFKIGTRSDKVRTIDYASYDVMIIEGLHALNPLITNSLPEGECLRIFINLIGGYEDASGNEILSGWQMRFVRRLIRDYHHRNSGAANTFRLWDMVVDGEKKYLFPFSGNRDIAINSIHEYEPCLFEGEAAEILSELPESDSHFKVSADLIERLRLFESLDENKVPESSMLREFL